MADFPPMPPPPLQPAPSPSNPLPIAQFNNEGLRKMVEDALAGVDPGHGNAVLDITNKGAGVMVVERSKDGSWAAILADRYNFAAHQNEIQVAVRKSW